MKLLRKFSLLCFSAFLMALAAMPVASALTLENDEMVVIDENVNDDVYISAGNAEIDAEVNGDLYVFGGTVSIDGRVQEDVMVLGGSVTITGDVEGDLRVLGGDILIFGDVGDDLIVAGGRVKVENDSKINGSVLAGAGYLSMEGEVREDIKGAFGALFIRGRVNGNVVVNIQEELELAKNADIRGNLEYSALLKGDIPDGAVRGKVVYNKFEAAEKILGTITAAAVTVRVVDFLSSLIFAFLFVVLAPNLMMRTGQLAKEHVLKSFGIGVLAFILTFIAPTILVMTVIGVPLAVVILLMMGVAFYLAKIFAATWLASYIVKDKKKGKKKIPASKWAFYAWATLILLAYHLLGFLPYLGHLIKIVMFCVGLGVMFIVKQEYWEFLRDKKKI